MPTWSNGLREGKHKGKIESYKKDSGAIDKEITLLAQNNHP